MGFQSIHSSMFHQPRQRTGSTGQGRQCSSSSSNGQIGLCIGQKERTERHPQIDYRQLLGRHKSGGCPALLLAPMENLADRPCRIALQQVLGDDVFDEACTEFIRVPRSSDSPDSTVKGITASYDAMELGCVPLAAQLMGSNKELLSLAALQLVQKEAPRIDLNCGCPANVVTGGGAGSSLLKDPDNLYAVVAALVAAVAGKVPVTVKMRSGFHDTSLFNDNLLAVQEAGASFVTIHARTKLQGYSGAADWALIAAAKQLLQIPVIGNGDVVDVCSAVSLLKGTGCDGLMVGRGALQDPLLFRRIRTHFQPKPPARPGNDRQDAVQESSAVEQFIRVYASYGFDGRANGSAKLSQSGRIGRLKKVMKYIFSGQPQLRQACCHLLKVQPGVVTADQLLEDIVQQVRLHWEDGGPSEHVPISHF